MTSQFECPECGQTFDQRSRLERHRRTTHPPKAPSAADVEMALKGIDFPEDRSGLVEHATGRAEAEVVDVLRELPSRSYRDAAEVARALGAVRRREDKPGHQPSRFGASALDSPSAARLAKLLGRADFPLSDEEVREMVEGEGGEEIAGLVEDFGGGPYRDMADVMRELGRREDEAG